MYPIKSQSFWKASSSTPPPNFTRLSRARSRSCSTVQPDLATPITGTVSAPCFTMLCRAGKIFLWARSPVAPKKTNASEVNGAMGLLSPDERRGRIGHAPELPMRSEEHTSELQSPCNLVCRLLLEKKKKKK